MEGFHDILQSWQSFYATVAAVAATLTGLLFVSLSLNRERLRGSRAPEVVAMARWTFGDFLYVLMLALVFLVPHQLPFSLTVALLTLGFSRAVGLLREISGRAADSEASAQGQALLRQIGLPALASLGLIAVAVAAGRGNYNSIFGLVFVVAALLVTACWNAWVLLIEE
jgi:hypothetical protein